MIEKVKRIINKRTVVSIFLSLFVFQLISGIFVSRYRNTDMNIRIEATGEKNLKSKGSGIQIKSILVNGTKKISPVEFFDETSWLQGENGYLTWVGYKIMNNYISAKGDFRSLRISLTKETYSGIAKIYLNDKLIKELPV